MAYWLWRWSRWLHLFCCAVRKTWIRLKLGWNLLVGGLCCNAGLADTIADNQYWIIWNESSCPVLLLSFDTFSWLSRIHSWGRSSCLSSIPSYSSSTPRLIHKHSERMVPIPLTRLSHVLCTCIYYLHSLNSPQIDLALLNLGLGIVATSTRFTKC